MYDRYCFVRYCMPLLCCIVLKDRYNLSFSVVIDCPVNMVVLLFLCTVVQLLFLYMFLIHIEVHKKGFDI